MFYIVYEVCSNALKKKKKRRRSPSHLTISMLYAERLQMVSPCASKHPRDLKKKNKNKKKRSKIGCPDCPCPTTEPKPAPARGNNYPAGQ